MRTAAIQLEMFAPPALPQQSVLTVMRPHRWAHMPMSEVELAEITVEAYEGRWMWSVWICSRNGASQGYKPFPKWGKFADSRPEAIIKAADEMRDILHRLTADEQVRVTEWLGNILSMAQYH
ncbi:MULTISPECIES: hypothetical protein [Pseudomonas]|uniref:Uncharacterized protein n=1 Tax=Pseudomonas fluorescens TaxID=294 RepID=A0A166QT64_PSEFL|nr:MULTISPECIES: hypothetical protein [Pseudomonas]KZN20817.1 hypothetical protein A1D17_04550 [Pseudomonas fluorescens]